MYQFFCFFLGFLSHCNRFAHGRPQPCLRGTKYDRCGTQNPLPLLYQVRGYLPRTAITIPASFQVVYPQDVGTSVNNCNPRFWCKLTFLVQTTGKLSNMMVTTWYRIEVLLQYCCNCNTILQEKNCAISLPDWSILTFRQAVLFLEKRH